MTEELQKPAPAEASVVPKRPRGRPRKIKDPAAAPVAPQNVTVIPSVPRVKRAIKAVEATTDRASTRIVSPLQYVFAIGRRKRATAKIFLYMNGHGEIEVNGKSIDEYFPLADLQRIIRAPLENSSFAKTVRVVVKVLGGGVHGQAGAVRHGITRALVKIDETLRPAFRARGFLTRDPREKERKKPGLKKARRGPQWAKR